MAAIHSEDRWFEIGSWPVLLLPARARLKLAFRGMSMVAGVINGVHVQTARKPDGEGI